MKVKFLAAAVAALGSVSAFALPLPPASTTPDTGAIFYIAGASAQKNQVAAIVPNLFQTPADVVKITVAGALLPTEFQNAAGTATNSSTAWLGLGSSAIAGISGKKLLVIYNSTNGSAAGINQLLSTAATPVEIEAQVLSLPDATCTAPVAATPPAIGYTATCTATAARAADLALSDVAPTEFYPGVLKSGTGYAPLSSLTVKTTALEGFGVIVNQKLYSALQANNVNEGLLPSTCAPVPIAPSTLSVSTGSIVTGAACQPTLRSADYAAIATDSATWAGAESLALVPSQPSQKVTLCRRDVYSGTQAASNLFFLNAVCGLKGYFGALTPKGGTTVGTALTSTATLDVVDNAGTGLVETPCVKSATGYALGVVGMGELDEADGTYPGTTGFYYVKLDNVSPNFYNGALDSKHRITIKDGNYKFATDMTAMYITGGLDATIKQPIANQLILDLTDHTKGNNTGLANIDAPLNWTPGNSGNIAGATTPDYQNAKFDRKGNNCAPLQ